MKGDGRPLTPASVLYYRGTTFLTRSSALSDQRPEPLRARARRALGGPAQQLVRVGRRQCAAEEKALCFVAVVLLQEQQLRKALDTLGGDVDPQRSRHGDDGGGNRPIVAAIDEAGHERTVDFQSVDGEMPQPPEARIARPEIIDGQRSEEHTSELQSQR